MMVTTEDQDSGTTKKDRKEKELKEQLMVLEEQRFLVQEMLSDANKRRRFDEVAALAGSLEDLDKEVMRMNEEISKLD